MCHVALKDTHNTSKQDFGAPVVGQVADEDVLCTMAGAWGGLQQQGQDFFCLPHPAHASGLSVPPAC